MKICQIMLNPGFGGAERIFVDTCKALAEDGQSVLAIVHPQFIAQDELCQPNIEVVRLKAQSRHSIIGKFRLWRILKNKQPELIHLHLRKAISLTGRLGSLLNIPVIASMHNYGKVKAYSKADRIIALTPGQVPHIVQGGYPKERVEVIPNFSMMDPLNTPRGYEKPKRFLAYGRFVKKKGFSELIEAVSIAKKKGHHIHLSIGGGGELDADLRARVQELELTDQVKFIGWIEDVKTTLDQHDIFVLPSLSEPFGIVLLEAMARRLPIISTLTEGPKDFLSEDMAWLCSPHDVSSLADLLISANVADDNLLKTFSQKGYTSFLQCFTKEVVVNKLRACYEKLLG